MKTPYFIEKIDWTELRNQKSALIEVMNTVTTVEQGQALEGILALIDAVQDYAVDELDVDEMHVYDFELEDERDGVVLTDKTKTIYICPQCHSDNVQIKAWVRPNKNNQYVDEINEGDEFGWCEDECLHTNIETAEVRANAEVIGFQVVGEDGTEQEGEIHPYMDASFCVYSLAQANEMLNKNVVGIWRLLTIWTGDIEDATKMFEGDPRA
jgi:hypothetical protein